MTVKDAVRHDSELRMIMLTLHALFPQDPSPFWPILGSCLYAHSFSLLCVRVPVFAETLFHLYVWDSWQESASPGFLNPLPASQLTPGIGIWVWPLGRIHLRKASL